MTTQPQAVTLVNVDTGERIEATMSGVHSETQPDGRELDARITAAWINDHRVKAYSNPYPSPEAACDAWMKGTLWGNPIRLEGQIHVYGLWMRNWSKVYVQFTRYAITIVIPPSAPVTRSPGG